MHKRYTLMSLGLILMILGGLLVASQELPQTETEKPKKNLSTMEQHFIFNNGAEPETLDPSLITGLLEGRIVDALFEGLTTLHPETLVPMPGVAERWSISEDQLTYTFHLRKNAKWNDGTPLTATDFERTWKRVLTPKTGASYAYQLYPIAGAQAFHKGKLKDFSKVGIKVKGSYLLEVKLERPCPYFLDLTSFCTLFPVPMDRVEKHEDRWVLPKNILGNGAFQIVTWEPRQKIVLEPNLHYWDNKNVSLKKVTIYPYDNQDTSYRLYLDGKIHWLSDLPKAKLDEIKRHDDFYLMPVLGTYFYRFNVKRKPFDDVRVRKAFSLAIDREEITRDILRGMGLPTTAFCPKIKSVGFEPVKGLSYDPEKAKKILSEAGYGKGGKSFPEVEILYNTSEQHKAVAESLAQQWKKALGVQVSLRNTEWKIFLNSMDQLDYSICRSGWFGDYTDPNTFFDMFVTDGGNNRTGWSNPEYDRLLKASQGEADNRKRNKIFQDMERILIEKEFPILPLYIYMNKGLIKPFVQGWHENIRDLHSLKHIWLEE